VLPIATIALVFSAAGCSTTTHGQQSTPTASPVAARTVDRCAVKTHGVRLAARLDYDGDDLLPPRGITPRTSAAEAKKLLLTSPALELPAHHKPIEVFAVYDHLNVRRPVWVLLVHNVPAISLGPAPSPGAARGVEDAVNILDDRTRKPVSLLLGLPNGCKQSA
jgi:hypothetical protein